MGTEAEEVAQANGTKAEEVPTELEKQIIRQIEYYFGDYNLTRDKFLREQLKVDDGWVPLETMVKFNRLKKLSSDFIVICEALKKSSKKMMEVSEDNTKIRRYKAPELPEDYKARQKDLDEKTLYVKGFRKDNTLDDLLDFFKDFGVENIFMRRVPKQSSKPFKGSVFVTFDSKEDADKFLNEKGIKYKGTELLKEWKNDYMKRKDEFYANLREEKAKKQEGKLKTKKENAADGANQEDSSAVDEDAEGSSENMVRGCLLKLENLGKECDREQIKEAFQPLGNVVYVDYHHGLASATIRFETAEASSVLEKIPEEDGKRKIQIGSSLAEVSSIEGEKEEEYWKHISVSRKRSREFMRQKQGNRGRQKWQGKNRGQHQWKRGNEKRSRDETKAEQSHECPEKEGESQPPEKKIKTESKENQATSENVDKKDETEQPRKKAKVESSTESSSKKQDNPAAEAKEAAAT